MSLSPFTRWAHDESRTDDERYMIWLICDAARLQDHWLHASADPARKWDPVPQDYHRELFLNPALVPPFSQKDTELAASVIPFLKKFPLVSISCIEKRRIRDAGALRFFTALEEVYLNDSAVRSIEFVRSLPRLRVLQVDSGELEDISPLGDCRELRDLRLNLIETQHFHFAPPVYWLDAGVLDGMALTRLHFLPNAAVLRGLRFPALRHAVLHTTRTVQPDLTFLPEMPELRHLALDGVQTLAGIGRFSSLLSLKVSGPLRLWDDLSVLPRLEFFEADTDVGWPRDVAPLAQCAQLRLALFGGEFPRNLWPLSGAPRLCEVAAPKCPTISMDIEAIRAALTPWDELFACHPPRRLAPLRFLKANCPVPPPPDELTDNPLCFLYELRWMHAAIRRFVGERLDGEKWSDGIGGQEEYMKERVIHISITRRSAADRLPEVIEGIRTALALSSHDWLVHLSTLPHMMLIEELQEEAETPSPGRWRQEDDDDASLEKYIAQKQHLIDTDYQRRTADEEGEKADPADFTPPEPLRAQPAAGASLGEKIHDFFRQVAELARDPLFQAYNIRGQVTFDAFCVPEDCAEAAAGLMERDFDDPDGA